MPFKRFVNLVEIIAVLAVLVFVIMLFANEPGGGGAANASPGAQIFQANCASCHGADGSGGVGPKLAGTVAKKFPNVDDQIAVVTDGRSSMPSFDGDLTAEQIREVVEYTRTDLGK